jgi:long-chain acyl-CoA synthetase
MDPKTLPQLLLRNALVFGDRDAIREHKYGIWQSYTWKDYLEQVRTLAAGLHKLGFRRGDKLAVIGDNRPRLYCAMLAAQSLGGVSLGVYQDSIQKEMGYVLSHADARFVVAEDVEQVDKLLEVRSQLPHVARVLYEDPKGLESNQDPWLMPYGEALAMGQAAVASDPDWFEREVAQGKGSDVAIFSYTSGTTGMPKGAMLTHDNLITSAAHVVRTEGWKPSDEMLARYPMAWIGDFTISVSGAIQAGLCINCPESQESVQRDYREIGPTIVFAPPRSWEVYLTLIQVRMEEADWLKRKLYEGFMAIAHKVEARRQAQQRIPVHWRVLNRLGDTLVRAPLRDLLGLTRIRYAYTGGAPLGPDVFNYFRALGLNLKQLYGLTESCATCILQPDGEANAETVGRPLPGVEVKIAESGEIFLRGEMVFRGYYKNEEATSSTVDRDGWLASGDAGFLDRSGHVKVIDRAKDVSRLGNGTLFAPQYLENKLKFSPYIQEAVAIGVGRDYVGAMINIDLDSLENWAERKGIPYSGYQELSQKPEVYALLHGEIQRINLSLARDPELMGAQIRRFLILNKELDADDGEITRTRKLRRSVIAQRYHRLIDALYSGAQAVDTEILVTYEDGRTATIRGQVRVWDVDPGPGQPALRRSA